LLFLENYPTVIHYILGVTGVLNVGFFSVKPEVEGSRQLNRFVSSSLNSRINFGHLK